jgi:large subunit ribosomal protein L7/L12
MAEETKKELTGVNADLISKIESLSVKDLAELVKELEDRFGVSAAAPVAMAAAAGPAEAGAAGGDEKSEYTIMLTDAGAQKIAVIKAVREVRPDLGLKEAKDLVDGAPKEIKANAPKEEAQAAKEKIEAAGGKVELK